MNLKLKKFESIVYLVLVFVQCWGENHSVRDFWFDHWKVHTFKPPAQHSLRILSLGYGVVFTSGYAITSEPSASERAVQNKHQNEFKELLPPS